MRMMRHGSINSVNRKVWMYNRGVISLVGDWPKYQYSGTVTLAKNADNLSLGIGDGRGWAYGQNQIDLTNIRTLYFYGNSSNVSSLIYFAVTLNNGGLTNDAQAQISVNGVNALVSLDVSALTGNYYVRFGRFGTNIYTTVTCYEVYGV